MVHSKSSKGKKSKPRGRPFTSENNPRKARNNVLSAPGRESGDRGDIIAPQPIQEILEPLKQEIEPIESTNEVASKFQHALEEGYGHRLTSEGAGGEYAKEKTEKPKVPPQLIDFMDFFKGKNKLRIAFIKNNNRQFRVQFFLNDDSEVRPVTYTGSNMAHAFWKLLKASLEE